ncbi:MAG: transglycosylase SLT domain-containing protein [Phascolarctobacterium sp.]|nr:transglycosylase SLT domain-containing protein [Candidatus Phascolarctobacterium caballi]
MQTKTLNSEQIKRRKAMKRMWRRYNRHIMAAVAAVVLVTLIISATMMIRGGQNKPETLAAQTTERETTEKTAEATTEQAAGQQVPYPFNLMSQDWDGESLQDFKYYEVPEEFAKTGGYMPECFQKFTYIVCDNNGVDYALVLAMIEVESGYRWNVESKEGSQGFMQVNVKWHEDRMDKLGIDNVKNPYFNIMVAVDFIKELQGRFETEEEVLTAYNYGVTGAYQNVWNKGLTETEYSRKVQQAKARIIEQIGGEKE